MKITRKHKKELDGLDPYRMLQEKMWATVPDGCYWGASLDIRCDETQLFTRGIADTATSDTNIGVKFWYVDDFSIYFGGNKINETLVNKHDIEIALERAYQNKIRTTVILPKEYVYANRSSPSLEESLGMWVKDMNVDETDLADELKCASNQDGSELNIRPINSYELRRRRLYFTNSDGIEVETEQNNFRVTCKLERLDERSIKRRVGCSFNDPNDILKIQRLIKHTSDITMDQHIKKSRDFVELTNNLFEICVDSLLPHKQRRIRSTAYTVINPFTGFIHEAIGHPCEESMYFERLSVDDPKYYVAPLYPKTHQKFPKFITFSDNPTKRISNMSLFGVARYDDEGFKTMKKTPILNGNITGRRIGSSFSTGMDYGNAYSTDLDGLPIPRMSISTLEHDPNGPKSMEELVEIAKGLNRNPIVLCFKHQGYVDELGRFALGNENSPDSAEIYIYNPREEEFLSIKNPIVMVGNVYNSLANCILADKWSMSIDPGLCGKDNPVKYDSDNKPTSQVAPLGILQNVDIIPLTTKDKIIDLKTD